MISDGSQHVRRDLREAIDGELRPNNLIHILAYDRTDGRWKFSDISFAKSGDCGDPSITHMTSAIVQESGRAELNSL